MDHESAKIERWSEMARFAKRAWPHMTPDELLASLDKELASLDARLAEAAADPDRLKLFRKLGLEFPEVPEGVTEDELLAAFKEDYSYLSVQERDVMLKRVQFAELRQAILYDRDRPR